MTVIGARLPRRYWISAVKTMARPDAVVGTLGWSMAPGMLSRFICLSNDWRPRRLPKMAAMWSGAEPSVLVATMHACPTSMSASNVAVSCVRIAAKWSAVLPNASPASTSMAGESQKVAHAHLGGGGENHHGASTLREHAAEELEPAPSAPSPRLEVDQIARFRMAERRRQHHEVRRLLHVEGDGHDSQREVSLYLGKDLWGVARRVRLGHAQVVVPHPQVLQIVCQLGNVDGVCPMAKRPCGAAVAHGIAGIGARKDSREKLNRLLELQHTWIRVLPVQPLVRNEEKLAL
eukprot:4520372-Pleurochrysis_carterae.AAC.3